MIRHNLSKMAREIDVQGKAVFKDIGDSLAAGIWEEFKVLVIETPQWSGTTAASWNLFMQGRVGPMGGTEVREQPAPKSKNDALHKGHWTAVQVAIAANYDNLLYISSDYRTANIAVSNHSPAWEIAEEGPVREINRPGLHAFERFKQRLTGKAFDPIRNRKI